MAFAFLWRMEKGCEIETSFLGGSFVNFSFLGIQFGMVYVIFVDLY